MSINKAVMYLFIAAVLTTVTWSTSPTACRQRPNRVQTAVETLYQLMRKDITGGNMDAKMATTWFPFIGALFLFIWFSNLIGYIPLPTNTEHTFDVFGVEIPSFALYAATANISVTLALTLVVVVQLPRRWASAKRASSSTSRAGSRPASPARMVIPIFFIEVISQFVRVVSLSVRLFANILAGHLLILFMGGGLAVHPRRRGTQRDHRADRHRLLPLRDRPGRNAPGLHLRDARLDLSRRSRLRPPLNSLRHLGATPWI